MARSRPALAEVEAPELLPQRASAVGTHRRVLEAALVAFGERGFNGVTVREIAKAAGIHVSSIYGHIPSKEMLLYELALLGHEDHYELVTSAVAAAGPDVVERVKAYVRAHVHAHTTHQQLARVSNSELHALTGPRHEHITKIRDSGSRLLIGLVDEGTQAGVFTPFDPWLAAAMIIGLGLRVAYWWGPQSIYSAETVEDAIVDAAMRILGVAG